MQLLQTRAAKLLLLFIGSTLVGLYFASQFYVNFAPDEPIDWRRALVVNLTYYYLWGASVPLVVAIARRWRIERGARLHAALMQLAISIALTIGIIVAAESIIFTLAPVREVATLRGAIGYGIQRNFHSSFPTYWLIVFVYYAFDYYAKFRDRELRASQLEMRLTMSQLQALKMQLNPHFLFNTLNSISSLMYSNVEAADAMITRLGDFLRMALENEAVQEVPLRRELEFLQRYLDIEKIRLEERLTLTLDVDHAALDARVPNLGLQPLVENAIHHGIAHLPHGGAIELSARREGEMLRIDIRNDRPERAAGVPMREGIGLTNIRARLGQLYGARHDFHVDEEADGSLHVTLSIPYRTAA
ncbi:MAG TPA: histidine kinase [Thermoanaerobaculia bacterium]|nr:histidine kinase [Thermoanaerobaculia bacterium]